LPRNGSGTFSLNPSTWSPAVDGVTATTADWNTNVAGDIESGLTASVSKDGQTTMTGNLPMGNNRITGLAAASAITDAANANDVQSGRLEYLTATAGTNTITASLTGFTAYAAGNTFRFVAAGANTGAATLNINAVGAKSICRRGTTALVPGDIASGAAVEVFYDGTNFQLLSTPAAAATVPGFLYGMGLTNNAGDVTNDIDFAAGQCVDSTGASLLIGGAMTKQLDAAWAVGTNAGGRLSAAAIANTTYHCFAILKDSDGSVDYGFDVSPTGPTMPAGYTKFRRLGSIVRAAAAILPFVQDGDRFTLQTPVEDVTAANPGTVAATATLASLPNGLRLRAIVNVGLVNTASTDEAYISDLSQADVAAGTLVATVRNQVANVQAWGPCEVMTSTSRGIRRRVGTAGAGCTLRLVTGGWYDDRGRSA
jgi:hypothetical protein